MTIQEIKKQVEKLGETTNYDINLIEIDAIQAVYDEYSLPALYVEDKFHQGDATDEEIQNTIDEINKKYPKMTKLETPGDLFSFLDDEFIEKYEIETLKVIKANWIEFYKEEIEEFLKENYPTSGGQFGYDYSIYINIETGEIFEIIKASSNWMFANDDENRKLIFHADNYDNTFTDFTDLISENGAKTVSENLGIELPKNWDEMDYHDQVEWTRENASDEIDSYDSIMREEAIEIIIDLIEDED